MRFRRLLAAAFALVVLLSGVAQLASARKAGRKGKSRRKNSDRDAGDSDVLGVTKNKNRRDSYYKDNKNGNNGALDDAYEDFVADSSGPSPVPNGGLVGTRNLGFVDSLFGIHKMDGGSTILDYLIVPCGLVVCGLHLAVVYKMWGRRHTDVALKVKSITLVAIQSISGVVWYFGFVVRFGHFTRPASGLMAMCGFWNYYVSVVFGFGIWSACILFRLLRLYYFFILNEAAVNGVPGLGSLGFKTDWAKILGVLVAPLAVIYGFLLPIFGDNQHKKVGGKYICVYEGKVWATIDTVAFVAVWALLFYLVHALRRVNDQFGEYKSIRKALFVSASCLGSLILVDVLQIDGLWFGRSLITCSVLASVTVFFYTQNKAEITRVLIGDTTIDRNIEEQVSLAEQGGSDEAILEGGISPPRSPMRFGNYGQSSAAFFGNNSDGDMQDVPITPEQAPVGGMRQRGGQRKQQSAFTNAILLD